MSLSDQLRREFPPEQIVDDLLQHPQVRVEPPRFRTLLVAQMGNLAQRISERAIEIFQTRHGIALKKAVEKQRALERTLERRNIELEKVGRLARRVCAPLGRCRIEGARDLADRVQDAMDKDRRYLTDFEGLARMSSKR